MNDPHIARYTLGAIRYDRSGDQNIWLSALYCSKVVNRNTPGERGKTLALAYEMNRSPDTIEDRAHGYWMYEELCGMDGGQFRQFVRHVRKLPHIHFSHFRQLWDIKQKYNLHLADCLSLLQDLYKGEASSRELADIAKTKYGEQLHWSYYTQKVMKSVHIALGQPDLPSRIRAILKETYEILGDDE